jgi:hypothetical protein
MSDNPLPPGLLDAPAPWEDMRAEVLWMIPKSLPIDQPLPAGSYHPLEQPNPDDADAFVGKPDFKGGLAMVWIVRYSQTPVGPYNELIFSPGAFTAPGKSKPGVRITRIYVDSPSSAYNGRRNWNVPKHLARFKFTVLDKGLGKTLVEVFDAEGDVTKPISEDERPFFSGVYTPSKWLPSVPLDTSWKLVDFGGLPQPPLPQGPSDHPEETGTDTWCAFACTQRGKIGVAYWEPAPVKPGDRVVPGEYGDGVGFPKCNIWSVGARWPEDTKLVAGLRLPLDGTMGR